jgi:hypothetical protein
MTEESSRRAVELCEVLAEGGSDPRQFRLAEEQASAAYALAYQEYEGAQLECETSPDPTRARELLREAERRSSAASAARSCLHVASFEAAMWAGVSAVEARASWDDLCHDDEELANLLKEITGNPFREARLNPTWLEWNDGVVCRIAKAIYEERRFQDMPVLADALEEAGCSDADLLNHCRQGAPHVRGCWALDFLLDKD